MATAVQAREIEIPAESATLSGIVNVPQGARGVVLFAHGSGSGRLSPRNNAVARTLQGRGLGTLLIDLLTAAEERAEARTGHLRFNIGLLASRLEAATSWLTDSPEAGRLPIGYFGASTGAAAALRASVRAGPVVGAIVSRGGRPDLTGPEIAEVRAPTLLIVGSADVSVVDLNRQAYTALRATKELAIVPGASHLFEEPGTLDQVARLAGDWFLRYLPAEGGGEVR